jgi:hypothetical protein
MCLYYKMVSGILYEAKENNHLCGDYVCLSVLPAIRLCRSISY